MTSDVPFDWAASCPEYMQEPPADVRARVYAGANQLAERAKR